MDEEKDSKSPLIDSYSASLRLASLETLTGKPPASLGLPGFPFLPTLPVSQPATTSTKVPNDTPTLSLQDALANFQKTALQPPPPSSLLPGSPLQQLLASQGGLSGLPKPADLIQQAQTLQLLAHLQTMLMNPGPASSANSSNGQPATASSISGPLNNATNFQKVGFIHIYEWA